MPYTSGNFYLTQAQMEENATYFWETIQTTELGWTLNAVAAMLGNMQTESTINPGIWEGLDDSNPENGYGLVQWTPSTKYTEWCTQNGYDKAGMVPAILRILYEQENSIQWYATESYPMSFAEFLGSTSSDIETLAYAWMYNYERPASLDQPQRKTQARAWYNYLAGITPPTPTPTTSKKMPLWMYLKPVYRR